MTQCRKIINDLHLVAAYISNAVCDTGMCSEFTLIQRNQTRTTEVQASVVLVSNCTMIVSFCNKHAQAFFMTCCNFTLENYTVSHHWTTGLNTLSRRFLRNTPLQLCRYHVSMLYKTLKNTQTYLLFIICINMSNIPEVK